MTAQGDPCKINSPFPTRGVRIDVHHIARCHGSRPLGVHFASAGAAEAQAPAAASPFKCLQAWDQDGESLDYVGDGWVGVRVIDVGGIFLGCGDELSGVVHIAHPDTTGTLHPIFENTQNAFIQCFQLIANSGTRRADDDFPTSRTRAEFTYYVSSQFGDVPQTATIIFAWSEVQQKRGVIILHGGIFTGVT